MPDFNEIREHVTVNGDVLTISMSELRDAVGAKRLGSYIIEDISNRLAGEGLGHTPRPLPLDSWAEVRLYRLGSPIAKIITAAEEPGTDGDDRLRELASNEPAQIINKVRALVCP